MLHRLASLILLFLTIGFFVLHQSQKNLQQPKFVDIIEPSKEEGNYIAHNEYLILMEQGFQDQVPEVLRDFGLTLAAPLGEWLHVVRGNANAWQETIAIASPKARDDQELLAKLEAHPAIHSAHLNFIQLQEASFFSCVPSDQVKKGGFEDALIIPRDPLYPSEWYLSEKHGINLPQAWAITTGSAENVIAVVDRNFEFNEKDLSPERCQTRKYYYENVLDYFWQEKFPMAPDNQNHGTQVLSVLAPCTDNGVGLSGIDWHAQIFAVDTGPDRSLSARMFAILWASGIDVCTSSIVSCPKNQAFQRNSHPAVIINASFGFAGSYLKEPAYGPVLDVIGTINRQGKMLVASAGNEGQLADRRLPGAAGGVLSVGSSNRQKQSSYFSNWGRSVDVLAPGEDIVGLKDNQPISLNGTSFSSPFVAGGASLLLAVAPELSWKHVEYIFKKTASPMSCVDYCPATMNAFDQAECQKLCCRGQENVCAAGIIDVAKAVKLASLGIPKIPLVDVDDYFLPLSEHNNMRAMLKVKNWGAIDAAVRMKEINKDLKVYPEQFVVPAINEHGFPGTKEVLLYYDKVPDTELVLSVILEAAPAHDPSNIQDRIEAIAEIVPDHVVGKRQYRELYLESFP